MKTALLIVSAIALCLPSCSTDPTTGKPAFLGLTGLGWVGVAEDAGKSAVISYGNRRVIPLTASK